MNWWKVRGIEPLSAPGTDHMRIRRFAIIKTFSIKARLYTAGLLALVGLLVTGGSGYIGLTQSNDGLTKSITATSAVLSQMRADMMHDAMRGDVLFALQVGPGGSPRLRQQIVEDVTAHADVFKVSIAELQTLELTPIIRAEVDKVLPLLDTYVAAAVSVSKLALTDQPAGLAKWDAFMKDFLALEDEMGTLGANIEEEGRAAGVSARTLNLQLINILLIALGTCALVMIVSNFLLARSISLPIKRVKEAIEHVVNGDLGGRHSSFDRASDLNDEVSQIGYHLEELRVKLRDALRMEEEIRLNSGRSAYRGRGSDGRPGKPFAWQAVRYPERTVFAGLRGAAHEFQYDGHSSEPDDFRGGPGLPLDPVPR